MQERLERLEAGMYQDQEKALERVSKKAKCKKSHQIQHNFNERVVECLEMARDEAKKLA